MGEIGASRDDPLFRWKNQGQKIRELRQLPAVATHLKCKFKLREGGREGVREGLFTLDNPKNNFHVKPRDFSFLRFQLLEISWIPMFLNNKKL